MKFFTLLRYFYVITGISGLLNVQQTMASVPSDYYRSVQNGNWNNVSSWQSSSDNISWSAATLTPGTAAAGITVRNGHTITVSANVSVDDVLVESGGTVDILSGITLTIANGVAATDFGVWGILRNAGTITPTGRLVFHNNGVYQHTHITTGGTIPFATWEDGSDCQIIGFTSPSPSHITLVNSGYNFYNFTWNCPNQLLGTAPTLSHSIIVRNNFFVISTGLGVFRMIVSTATGISTLNNFIQTGGVFNIINGNGGYSNRINLSGNFVLSGGVFQKGTGNTKGRLVFSGTTEQTFSRTGGTISGDIEFIVNPNAIVNFGTSIVEGTGTFILNNGATLITAHSQGISSSGATGAIQNTGTRTFSTQANYTYNGTSAQQTGNGLPATVNNLTVDNPAGVTLRSGTLTLNGELTIDNGFLDLGANALVSNGSFGSMGTGTLLTQNTSATPLTVNKSWGGTVEYNSSSAQTIVPGNYANLNGNGGSRTINGNVNISGTFTPGTPSSYTTTGSTINFNGSGAQNIPAFNYHNLTASIGGTKTVTGAANVSRTLQVLDDVVLNSNGNITLLASATSNANVAALNGSADIVGNVNIQSFISGAGNGGVRGSRTMSSPVNDALTGGQKTFEQLKNYMIVTGTGGAGNGFDAVPSGAPNSTVVYTYNNSLPSPFVPLANITTSLNQGSGFIYFFMGNRNNKDSNPGKLLPPFLPAEDVTLTYTGIINKGNIDIPITYNSSKSSMQGAFVAGNPYPSTIDWHSVYGSSTNIGSSITIVVGGQPNATYNAAISESNNGGSRYIQPGQGFYVHAGNGGGTLRFRESHKNTVEEPARLLSAPERPQLLASSGKVMASKNSSSMASAVRTLRMELASGALKEETLVAFSSGFDADADKDDSPYITGYALNLATLSSDNKSLAINLMPEAESVEEIKLFVNSSTGGNMRLSFTNIPSVADKQLFLRDKYLNTETEITSSSNTYEFVIDKSKAASYGSERFVLAFAPVTVLPVTFSEFNVTKKNYGAELKWTTASEVNSSYFEIERAVDVLTFEVIGKVQSTGEVSAGKSYYFIDGSPVQGNNYYRIKQVDIDGKAVYTEIKQLDFSGWTPKNAINKLILYPNPVEREFTIDIHIDKAVELSIVDMTGRKQRSMNFAQNERITFNAADLVTGNYVAELRIKETGELLGYGKFIKK